MNEKYIAGVGGGLILVSFLIIVLYPLVQEFNENIPTKNGTPGFSQLQAIKDEAKVSFQNNTVIEEFRELVGNVTNEMKNKISVGVNQTFPEN